MSDTDFDFTARYRVEGWPAVAVYAYSYVKTPLVDEETGELVRDWLGDCDEAYDIDTDRVSVIMVGDDIEHHVDVSDLVKIDEEDYCCGCGQIGCPWG